MSDIFKICAMCIISLVLLVMLKGVNDRMSLMLKLCITVVLFAACIWRILPVVTYVNDLFDKSQVSEYASVLIKALAISLVSHICATVCRDAGEGSIAYFAELAGRVQMLILAIPIIDEILGIAYGLLEFV